MLLTCLTLTTVWLVVTDAGKLYFEPKSVNIVCPDGHWTCDDQSTCCKIPDGAWGCCPYKDAQCCPDRMHCCPKGKKCNDAAQSCDSLYNNMTTPAVPATPKRAPYLAAVVKSDVIRSDVGMVCPDHSQCPSPGAACCRQYSGRYGCCNYPTNVCCDDGFHCCHVGTVCDYLRLVCVPYPSLDGRQDWTALKAGRRAVTVTGQVPAVDRTSSGDERTKCRGSEVTCAEGQTCCSTSSGKFGCCPLPRGVCCSDGLHCCPQGTSCDLAAGRCLATEKSAVFVPWSRKTPVTRLPPTAGVGQLRANDVKCPDQETSCPDGNTCCMTRSGQYGCCPLSEATCCDDKMHCCPHGMKCAEGKCESQVERFLSSQWTKMDDAV